jgi:transcriptional regulator with XRE-family HTH domain
MKSKVAERILAKTPEDIKIFAKLYGDLVVRINSILKEKGYSQKTLADKLEKKPSEIHKWLSGEHNFTLRSIAKLQAELGEILLEVPAKKPVTEVFSHYTKTTYKLTVYNNLVPRKEKALDWKSATTQIELGNVG